MAQQLLNLDELSNDTKVIIIKGSRHAMVELTVQEFINKSREAQELQKKGENKELTVDEQTEKAVEMLHEAYPTVPQGTFKELTIAKLTALLDFTLKTPEQIEEDVRNSQAGK